MLGIVLKDFLLLFWSYENKQVLEQEGVVILSSDSLLYFQPNIFSIFWDTFF